MIAFDTTFLIDYLEGNDACARFLETHRNKPLGIPTLALFEVYRGAARTAGQEAINKVASGLEWGDPMPLTADAAREAARIEGNLTASGDRVTLGDILIAGICHQYGARLVSRDGHFERIPDLEVITY